MITRSYFERGYDKVDVYGQNLERCEGEPVEYLKVPPEKLDDISMHNAQTKTRNVSIKDEKMAASRLFFLFAIGRRGKVHKPWYDYTWSCQAVGAQALTKQFRLVCFLAAVSLCSLDLRIWRFLILFFCQCPD